jgi:hypothetical protein
MVCCALESRASLGKLDVLVFDAVGDQIRSAPFDCLSGESSVAVNLVDVADHLAVSVDLSDQDLRCVLLRFDPADVADFGRVAAVNPRVHLVFDPVRFFDLVHILVVCSSARCLR